MELKFTFPSTAGLFVYWGGAGRRAPEDTRVGSILQRMKVNHESYDPCAVCLEKALEGASAEEALWKAYVAARTYPRTAVRAECFRKPCGSVRDGVRQLLREVVSTGHEPRELFTQGFGPNVRHYNA